MLSGTYACLEFFGVAPVFRQALIFPLWSVFDLLGLDPFSGEVPNYLQSIDVDVDGIGPSMFRLAVFTGVSGVALGLWALWQRVPRRRPHVTFKRHPLIGLVLAVLLTSAFVAYAWVVINKSLFIAWEPGIPGEENYFSAEHIGYAIFCLFGLLWWITVPFLLFLAYAWSATIRNKRTPVNIANQTLESV